MPILTQLMMLVAGMQCSSANSVAAVCLGTGPLAPAFDDGTCRVSLPKKSPQELVRQPLQDSDASTQSDSLLQDKLRLQAIEFRDVSKCSISKCASDLERLDELYKRRGHLQPLTPAQQNPLDSLHMQACSLIRRHYKLLGTSSEYYRALKQAEGALRTVKGEEEDEEEDEEEEDEKKALMRKAIANDQKEFQEGAKFERDSEIMKKIERDIRKEVEEIEKKIEEMEKKRLEDIERTNLETSSTLRPLGRDSFETLWRASFEEMRNMPVREWHTFEWPVDSELESEWEQAQNALDTFVNSMRALVEFKELTTTNDDTMRQMLHALNRTECAACSEMQLDRSCKRAFPTQE